MLSENNGVLAATTAFGKTVAAIGMIARRKVNTLILVHSRALLEQWKNACEHFLAINEPEPEMSETHRRNKSNSPIGIWMEVRIICTESLTLLSSILL